jgi:hypothetical protein
VAAGTRTSLPLEATMQLRTDRGAQIECRTRVDRIALGIRGARAMVPRAVELDIAVVLRQGGEAVSDRVPTEFEPYWAALERPGVKRARAATRWLLGFDAVPTEETVQAFARGCYDADPVAEAFVDEVYLGRSPNEGRRMLEQAIAHGVDSVADAPDSMRRFVRTVRARPRVA